MKKILSFCLALLVLGSALVFAGASGDKSAGGKPTVQVFHYMTQASKNAGLLSVEEGFAKKAGVTFENLYYNNGGDYYQQLATALASGQQPNVIMGNPAAYPHVVDNGFSMNLTNNAVIKGLNLTRGDLNDASAGGTVYAFPLDFKTYGVVYNVDIFNKLGLKPPTTQTELLDVCTKIKAAGIDPWIHCYSDSVFGDIEVRGTLWARAFAAGDKDLYANLMNGKKKLTDYPYITEALTTWTAHIPQQWMRRDAMANDQVKAVELFLAGDGAMFYTGTWNIGDIVEKGAPKNFNFGFFLLPIDNTPANTKMCVQTDQVFMVNPKAQNAQLGVQFMEYWITDGGMAWSEKTAMPLTSGASSSRLHPVVQALAAVKKSGNLCHIGDFDVPFNNEFQTIWRKALMTLAESQLTNGGMTVAQCLANMQRGFDDAIATNK